MSVASMGTTRVGSVGFAPVRGLHGLRPAPGYLVTRASDSRSTAALLASHRAPVSPQSTGRVLRTSSSSSRGTPDTCWACTPDELRRRGVGQEPTWAIGRGLTSVHRRPGPTRMLRVSTPGGARSCHRRAAGGPGACHTRALRCMSGSPFAAAAVRGTARYFVLTITCGRSAHQISSWPTTSSWLTRYSFSIAGSSP